jgi:hypothetical protein
MYTHCPGAGVCSGAGCVGSDAGCVGAGCAGSINFSLNIIPKFVLNSSNLNRKSKQQLISNKNFGNLLI